LSDRRRLDNGIQFFEQFKYQEQQKGQDGREFMAKLQKLGALTEVAKSSLLRRATRSPNSMPPTSGASDDV